MIKSIIMLLEVWDAIKFGSVFLVLASIFFLLGLCLLLVSRFLRIKHLRRFIRRNRREKSLFLESNVHYTESKRQHVRGLCQTYRDSISTDIGKFSDIDTIVSRVLEMMSEQMGADLSELELGTSFINDLNADSVDIVELIMELENEFNIRIPDEEAEKLQTIVSCIDYIMSVRSAFGTKEEFSGTNNRKKTDK